MSADASTSVAGTTAESAPLSVASDTVGTNSESRSGVTGQVTAAEGTTVEGHEASSDADPAELSPTSTLHGEEGRSQERASIAGDTSVAGETSTAEASAAEASAAEASPADSTPRTDQDRAEVAAYIEQLEQEGRTRDVTGVSPPILYQERVFGHRTEYRISPDGAERVVWADSIDPETGRAQDAKFVGPGEKSFYVPETLPEFLQKQAMKDAAYRLVKYDEAVRDAANPLTGIEIVTNDPRAAAFFGGLIDQLEIYGGTVTVRE